MGRNIALIVGIALTAAATMMTGCSSGSKTEEATTPASSSTPSSAATGTAPTQIPIETEIAAGNFPCPADWTAYTCPVVSANKGALTLPVRSGVNTEIVCKNIGFYTTGAINDRSILFKVPSGTEIVSPINGNIVSVRAMPAPHEYTKSIAIGGMPLLIYLYFVGDTKVEANATVSRGDVIGVTTGDFPTDNPTDSKMLGASILVNLLGLDSRMLDAASGDIWAGGAPSCYAP